MGGDEEGVAGSGGGDVEEGALLLEGVCHFRFGESAEAEALGEDVAADAHQDDVGELHALGAVHGHDGDLFVGGGVGVFGLDGFDAVVAKSGEDAGDLAACAAHDADAGVRVLL